MASRLVLLIRRVFDIRPGEGQAVLYSFLFVALAVASFLLAKPIRNGLFLATYGAHQLVYVYVGVPLALTAAVPLFGRLTAKVNQRTIITGSLIFFCLNVIGFWYAFRYLEVPGLPAIFYIWVNCYGIIVPVQAWTFANRVFDTRQARRLFGLIGSGASAGAIVGGLLAQVLVGMVGTVNLLLVLAGLIAACAVIVNMGWKVRRRDTAYNSASAKAPLRFGETARLVARDPYLRLIAAMVFIVAIVTQWSQFQFSLSAELRFADDPDRLTRFFGGFNFVMGVVALLVQLFVTGPALRQYGVSVTIMLLPIALAFGSSMILVWPVLWTVLMTNALDQGLRFSIDKATFELLYLPIPSNIKANVKGIIDLLVNRLADGVGGVLLGLMTQGFSLIVFTLPGAGLGLRGIAAVNLTLLVVWIAIAVALRRGYVEAIRDSIHRYRLDVEREGTRLLDRSAARILAGKLTGDDPSEVLYALKMFDVQHRQVPHPALRSLVTHSSAAVRAKALSILNHLGDRGVLTEAEALLRDPDLDVRTEALLYLAHHARIDPVARIQELGGFADFSIRAGMVAFLSRPGSMQNLDAARVILGTMVDEEGEEGTPARAEAARLIAMLPDEFGPELGRLLADPDPRVVRPALSAMGALQRSDLIEQALPALARQDLHADALPALVALGEAVVPRLGDLLSNGNGSASGNGHGNGNAGSGHAGAGNAGAGDAGVGDAGVGDAGAGNVGAGAAAGSNGVNGHGRLDAAVRREIPIVLAHIGGSEARRILTDHLLEADVILRFRVIAALNKLHQLHPDIELDRRPIEMVLTAEIMGHYRSYQIMGKLGDAFEHADPVALSLKQSMDHEVERIFRLMQLRWPQTDMYSAYVGLQSQNPSVRANALEFLDNILQPQVRSLIVPLLDSQVPVRERVELANRLLGTSVETPEQAVAALVASDDPWMRASGAYAIGMLRLTSLAPELDRLASATDDPLLRETVRAAREKLSITARPPVPAGEITAERETWEAEQQSMGIG